jgi:hypothetical protein
VAALVKDVELNDLLAFVRYLKTQITRAGVNVVLRKDVDHSAIEDLNPDAVIRRHLPEVTPSDHLKIPERDEDHEKGHG